MEQYQCVKSVPCCHHKYFIGKYTGINTSGKPKQMWLLNNNNPPVATDKPLNAIMFINRSLQ